MGHFKIYNRIIEVIQEEDTEGDPEPDQLRDANTIVNQF